MLHARMRHHANVKSSALMPSVFTHITRARSKAHLIQLVKFANLEEDDGVPVFALDLPVLLLRLCTQRLSHQADMTAAPSKDISAQG